MSHWSIPRVLTTLYDLVAEEHLLPGAGKGDILPSDFVRRARHHDAAIVEGLRRVKYLPDLQPNIEQVIAAIPQWLLPPERITQARTAHEFFTQIAGFTGNHWRMQAQVVKALIYDACVAFESAPYYDFEKARTFALLFSHPRWHEIYSSDEEVRDELDKIALHLGLLWAFQALHAMHVHGLTADELATESLRKYGHPVCRACFHPICKCGRVKEGDLVAMEALAHLPEFASEFPDTDEFKAKLKQGGWKKANVTPEMIRTHSFASLARSLAHCYDARNALFGGPLEGASRQRSEATGEYDGPAWLRETAQSGRNVRLSPLFVPTGYEEETEIGEDPTGPKARFVVLKEASDAAVSWPPVYANALGIPWTHVLRVTLEHLGSKIGSPLSELPELENGF